MHTEGLYVGNQSDGTPGLFDVTYTAVDFVTLTVEYCCEGDDYGECEFEFEKHVADDFHYGDTGTYVLEVCNGREHHCDGEVTVTDPLPDGLTYLAGGGSEWSVTESGGVVTAEHANATGLAPADCLPALEIEVEVADVDAFPGGSDAVRNCARLEHGGQFVTEERVRDVITR